MRKIKPYFDYIQQYLVDYIEDVPECWQAKVLACLDFSSILSFDKILSKISLGDIYVLKALIVSEEYNITTFANSGWFLNEDISFVNLNNYLSLNIEEFDIVDERIKRLVNRSSFDAVEKVADEVGSDEEKYRNDEERRKSSSKTNYIDDIKSASLERSIDGSGRKRSKEWNTAVSLGYSRELRAMIKNKNNQEKQAENSKKAEESKKCRRLNKKEEQSEKLFIKLCINYPEYEAFITHQHKVDCSLEMMQRVYREILDEYKEKGKEIY